MRFEPEERRQPISPEEIEEFRRSIAIGDKMQVEVKKTDWESMAFRQQVTRCRVVGKYKHVLEVEDKSGRRYTTTYIELLLQNRRL